MVEAVTQVVDQTRTFTLAGDRPRSTTRVGDGDAPAWAIRFPEAFGHRCPVAPPQREREKMTPVTAVEDRREIVGGLSKCLARPVHFDNFRWTVCHAGLFCVDEEIVPHRSRPEPGICERHGSRRISVTGLR